MNFRTLVMGCALATLSIAPLPAYADGVITEDSIKAFLDETTALTHHNTELTQSDIVEYLEDHISDRGVFTSNIMYDFPNEPLQTRTISLKKKDYIKNIAQGRNMMRDYVSEVTLQEADISLDGSNAKIKTQTTESGLMKTQGDMMMPFEGTSSCEQILETKKGNIMLASAACETIITFIDIQ